MLEVDSLGELHLPSGKVVGNRLYKSFYKQHYRPEDSRAAVVANREMLQDRLMSQIVAAGGRLKSGGALITLEEVRSTASKIEHKVSDNTT